MKFMSRMRNFVYVLVGAAFLLPTVVGAQAGPDLRQPSAKEWLTVGGNWGQTRYSTLSQINTDNVKNLKGAWMARLGSGFDTKYSQQATPLVKDGVMFVPTGQQDIFALKLGTGEILWMFTADISPRANISLWANRGVAAGEGSVFAVQADGHLLALNEKTGKVNWDATVGSTLDRYYMAGAPLYFDGLVYTGISGSDNGARGRVQAYEAASGREVWRFNTVPGPGDLGFDTWEGNSWETGGANVWVTPSVDPDAGLIYFNTGNAWPDYDGSTRGGDNLFTASIVALDAKSGKYKWHFQILHHEIWDFDAPNPVVLFDMTDANGQPRKALGEASKQGWLFILDRVTGEPIIPVEERPVPQEPRQKTSQTQPVPVGDSFAPQCVTDPVPGYVGGCMFDPYWEVANVTRPGTSADWAPSSYSPLTGLFYVTASVRARAYAVRSEAVINGEAVITRPGGSIATIGSKETGTLTALDPRTNKIVWQKEMPYPIGVGSGVLSTAGNLLFHGEPDGNFVALDSRTGEELWRFQTGFGADAPAVTFEVDGVQYVGIATGGTSLARSARGDAVWAFRLDGPLLPLNPPPAPINVIAFGGPQVATTDVSIGRTLVRDQGVASEYDFAPQRIKVAAGSTVTWTNEGSLAHSATDQGGTWDTGLVDPGATATVTFDKVGTYRYFCQPHPWMVAELSVT
jgi:alcohol dehydrogenase (cytochrome c)